jgi:cytochrome c oxidase subunit 2
VEVIGHQWWWEFRYPQYQVVTANELYLPVGRTVNFTMTSKDVIHSFWIPSLSGKRDVMPNHTNYLWFSPDSSGSNAWNGACAEFCGTSHANMKFRTFTVAAADFESWAKHQAEAAAGTPAPAVPTAPSSAATAITTAPATPAAAPPPAAAPATAQHQWCKRDLSRSRASSCRRTRFHRRQSPAALNFDDSLLDKGDAANGAKLVISSGGCLACHAIKGNPMMVGNIGPNLTHVATRTTIAAGLFPNDPRHLARWIKNAREMKPGV